MSSNSSADRTGQAGEKGLVAIIGASPKPDRFANRAQRMLMSYGHPVLPVAPAGRSVLDVPGCARLSDFPGPVDTVTLYVGPQRLGPIAEEILAKRPRRVIFNPGTESPEHRAAFDAAGIETLEECTLVMLRAGRF